MAESQVVEYKESWKDEYLKWICGFANAQGGRIYIGINDKGEVIGVKDIKKLLEDIPNKIRDKLGIIADVNRLEKDGIAYIEIIVAPSGVPINYQGEYHYRSGSTKQLLQGLALTQFLMEKTGIKWDSVSVTNIAADDLDEVSIEIFKREALRKKRISEADLKVSRTELLDHLNLLNDDKLKRAAVMLFHKRPSKLVEGCYVKVGKFGEGSDLQYQDQLEGSLFRMADQVIDLIYTKYLKAKITYEHNVRVETYPFPIDGHALETMDAAARLLEGKRDFASYMASGSKITDTVRTIRSASVRTEHGVAVITLTADGFLYNMVRIISGTLLDIAHRGADPGVISRITEARDRKAAGPTLPPYGLYLVSVNYEAGDGVL